MYFKEKVVQLRKEASMTQEFFAQEVGVSRQAVYKWEKGISYPEAEKLILIAKLFNVTIDSLLESDYDLFELRGLSPVAGESDEFIPQKKKKAPAKTPIERPVEKKIAASKKEAEPVKEKPSVEEITKEEKKSAVELITEIPAEEPVKKINIPERREIHTRNVQHQTRKPQPVRKQQKQQQIGLFDGLRGIFSRRK